MPTPVIAPPEAPTLGHVALHVRSLDVSVPFYCDILLLRLRRMGSNRAGMPMALLAFGNNHHDLALVEVGHAACPSNRDTAGLGHVAFRIGREIGALSALSERLDRLPLARVGGRTLRSSRPNSIFFCDPDGIPLEAYVEASSQEHLPSRSESSGA